MWLLGQFLPVSNDFQSDLDDFQWFRMIRIDFSSKDAVFLIYCIELDIVSNKILPKGRLSPYLCAILLIIY